MYFKNLPKSRYQMILHEKEKNDVKQDIALIVNQIKADYLFLGSFGRKGDK